MIHDIDIRGWVCVLRPYCVAVAFMSIGIARAEVVDSGELRAVQRVVLFVGPETVIEGASAARDCLPDLKGLQKESAALIRRSGIEVIEDFSMLVLGDWEDHVVGIVWDGTSQADTCVVYLSVKLLRKVQLPQGRKVMVLGYINESVQLLDVQNTPDAARARLLMMITDLADQILKSRGQ